MMSLAQLILVGNWLLEGGLGEKLKAFLHNRMALVLSSLLLLHLLGLLYTSDFVYGWEDIRKKAPLLVLPLILATSTRLNGKQFRWLLTIFIAAVTAGTFISMGVLYEVIHSRKAPLPLTDIRQISIFISHVRFSLLICVSICLLAWFAYHKKEWWAKTVCIITSAWLLLFLLILESLTGIAALLTVGFVLALLKAFSQPGIARKALAIALLLLPVFTAGWYLKSMVDRYYQKAPVDLRTLDRTTAKGNPYWHETTNTETENGNYIYHYICEKELREAWNAKSALRYDSSDLKGNELKYTLFRFLTSKGLRKDAEGVAQLSEAELRAIERGVANIDQMGKINLKARVNQVIWEIDNYRRGSNPSGHSLTQRFEYWSTALDIIGNDLLMGVGTGDVKNAFENAYEKKNSQLDKRWRLRSHNQFLAIAVGFGIIGTLWFVFVLLYPLKGRLSPVDTLYIIFFVTAFLSFFTEDTLETQAGVTFFAYFNCLLLFLRPGEEK